MITQSQQPAEDDKENKNMQPRANEFLTPSSPEVAQKKAAVTFKVPTAAPAPDFNTQIEQIMSKCKLIHKNCDCM